MKKKFKHLVLLFTDTDSLCYVCDEDPYEIMYQHKEDFDLRSQHKDSKYYCSDNKKVVGKMKDEYGGKSIVRFVGLRPKMYSILDESNNEKSTSKGHNAFIEFQECFDDKQYILKNGINTLAYGHKDI